ncbi:hypothetical protein NDU88_003994 [Pleurodeles waltl]|uniref:SAP domain-containing protein n=1 Tax=Pleurodeles waltl TaxID=8319 RepID=A0AAV7M5V9_PLEWA|nr:hypothetical protein NDU88_003994 [Pleurodeles waltl]
MSSTDVTVVELDTTPYLHLKMRELRSLCKLKKITMGPKPTKIQLQELLAEFEKANPSEGGNSEEEDSDLEENSPLPVLSRENRVPQTLTPKIIVRDAGSLTGETNTSEITEDSPSEEDIQLARMAKRLAMEKQLLAIERERKEMGLGPINGGSNLNRVRDSPDILKIPKGIVTKYEDGDDITKWFTAFERACVTRKVNRSHWGALLWEMFTGKCRDRLLTLSGKDAESYDLMKGTLIEGFGFSTEEYRIRFRGAQKSSSQTWVDFVDYSVKTLDGWLTGNEVCDYVGLYNLFMKEHILSNCFNEKLHQYLVDLGPISPQELGKKADHWVKTRVTKTSTGGDQKKGVTKTPQEKVGDTRNKEKESSVGPQKPEQVGGPQDTTQNKGGYQGKNWDATKAWCHNCKQSGHHTKDTSCPKNKPQNKIPGVTSVAMGDDSSDEEVFIAFNWKQGPTGELEIPEGSRHFHHLLVNGIPTTALRDTCASHTIVHDRLVLSNQYIPGETARVRVSLDRVTKRPVALVPIEVGGTLSWRRVVVSTDPLDCLLGNDYPEVSQSSREELVQCQSSPKDSGSPASAVNASRPQKKKKRKQSRKGGQPLAKVTASQGDSAPVGENSKNGPDKVQPDPQEVLASQATVKPEWVAPQLTEERVEEGCLLQDVVTPHSNTADRQPEPKEACNLAPSLLGEELKVWFWALTAVSGLCWLLAFVAALSLAWWSDPMPNSKLGPLTLLVMVGLLQLWVTSLGKLGMTLAKIRLAEVDTSKPKIKRMGGDIEEADKRQFRLGPITVEVGQFPKGNDLNRRM